MEILVKFPTRARPKQFKSCLDTWISLLSGKHKVTFLVNLDYDDPAADIVLGYYGAQGTRTYTPTGKKGQVVVEFVFGHPTCKHEACNMGMSGRRFDIAIVAADDMWPQVYGYDDIIATDMDKYYPGLDGALDYWDGFRMDDLQTLCIVGYNLYRRFNYFFNPLYISLYGDTENTAVFKLLNKLVEPPEWQRDTGNCLIKHLHPLHTKTTPDDLLKRNDKYEPTDGKLFHERKAKGFGIQEPVLSILICSLTSRHYLLKALLRNLYAQVFDLPNPDSVEILYNIDNREIDLGTKRNILLDQARGKYLCYIDDDDRVASDYISKILAAAKSDVDTIGFLRLMTWDLRKPVVSRYSVDCKEDKQISQDFWELEPFHLCPTKSKIAKLYKFPPKTGGEDSERTHLMTHDGVLKTGVTIEEILYLYDFRFNRTETQGWIINDDYKQPLVQAQLPEIATHKTQPQAKPVIPAPRPPTLMRPHIHRPARQGIIASNPTRSRHFENGVLKRT